MLGGIARRATTINEMGPEPKLILDLGNFSSAGTDKFNKLRTEAMLESYTAIGYDAVNIGRYEITQGKDFILKANDVLGGKLISANVLDADGNQIVQPYITKNYGSLRIGIIGLTYHQSTLSNPRSGAKPEVITREPIEVLRDFIPVMREKDKCDLIVVAGMLQQKDIEAIAEEFDGDIDMILTGHGFHTQDRKAGYAFYYANPDGSTGTITEPVVRDETNKRETGIILHKTGQQGKYLAKIYAPLSVDVDGKVTIGEFEGLTIDLDEHIPDAPEIVDILDNFHEKVKLNRDEFLPSLLGQRAEIYWRDYPDFVGSRHCGKCHSKENTSHNRTQHVNSMQVLTLNKEDANPECLKCHTTGYGRDGGFINKAETYYLGKIDCEACHGPAREHLGLELQIQEARKLNSRHKASDEQLALLDSIKSEFDTKIRKEVPEEICLQCHTNEWSPNFNYEEYVVKINHSTDPDAMPMNERVKDWSLIPPEERERLEAAKAR